MRCSSIPSIPCRRFNSIMAIAIGVAAGAWTVAAITVAGMNAAIAGMAAGTGVGIANSAAERRWARYSRSASRVTTTRPTAMTSSRINTKSWRINMKTRLAGTIGMCAGACAINIYSTTTTGRRPMGRITMTGTTAIIMTDRRQASSFTMGRRFIPRDQTATARSSLTQNIQSQPAARSTTTPTIPPRWLCVQ